MNKDRKLLRTVVDTLMVSVRLVLYGAAYGVVGAYIGLGIAAAGTPNLLVVGWILAWTVMGAAALGVWALRVTGAGRHPRRGSDTDTDDGSGSADGSLALVLHNGLWHVLDREHGRARVY